jgi:hypothetical protein
MISRYTVRIYSRSCAYVLTVLGSRSRNCQESDPGSGRYLYPDEVVLRAPTVRDPNTRCWV